MPDQIQRQTPLYNQESVWDYPRPPRVEPVIERIRVIFNGEAIADTTRASRVLETSHPPVYYIPPEDIRMDLLTRVPAYQTYCEFKGTAVYWTLRVGDRVAANAAWSYPAPNAGYESLKDHLAFYAGRVDECYVGEERVQPQAGDFYGGWITSKIVGPFKGGPGTRGW
ncbi:MAG: DUF427 domain-containing protein [Anaerolineae bacterium]|nr:DUF427 domain-containing protein [Anaerolineae bacterium]